MPNYLHYQQHQSQSGAGAQAVRVGNDFWTGRPSTYTAIPATPSTGLSSHKVDAQMGESYGKLVTVVENPEIKITSFSEHGLNQTITREVSPSAILNTMREPIVVLQQSTGNYLYLNKEAAIILNPAGRVITTYPASMFDTKILNIIK